jgi:predicted dithiol-disulfide oxidoreductase (DUF899 family)
MSGSKPLTPAAELAEKNRTRYPNENAEYRRARQALLTEEIELRRHIERVAEQRRALPPGGDVTKNYRFEGERGPVSFADLFGDKQSLVIYSYMFGPQRERPCPMCTSLLGAWNGEARDIEQRVGLAVVARSPIERLVAFKKERGWRDLKLYSDPTAQFSRDYFAIAPDGSDIPGFNVFTRRDGKIRHFWSGEMGVRAGRPGPGPAGSARHHADLDRPRRAAGRTREGLVPEARLRGVSLSEASPESRGSLRQHLIRNQQGGAPELHGRADVKQCRHVPRACELYRERQVGHREARIQNMRRGRAASQKATICASYATSLAQSLSFGDLVERLDRIAGDARAQLQPVMIEHYAIEGPRLALPRAWNLASRSRALRTFERLAISEGISDRALALMQKHPGLKLRHAIPWATALANELIYITRDLPEGWADKGLWIPYRK